jgi:hypothetical protein
MRRKFFGSSLLAIRYSLPFYQSLIASRHSLPFSARQEPRPPISFRPHPASHAPFCFLSPAPLKLMRVDELRKMRYGFMGKTQIDG